jgi:hypothetical protein
MGFLDSSSSCVDAILTRKGRELLAKNDGSFRITKFAYGDDEVNYQLYDLASDSDTDILNLPILEPSSNEKTALRYKLVTLGKGATIVASLIITPTLLVLGNPTKKLSKIPTSGAVTVKTINGTDNSYTVTSRDTRIATATISSIALDNDEDGGSTMIILIQASGTNYGNVIIDVAGNDTGATATIVVNVEDPNIDSVVTAL